MKPSRRKFLKYALGSTALTAGLGTWWVSTSQRRAARMLRVILADTRRKVPSAPLKPAPDEWSDNAITLSWLGHSTVLINFFGIRILTDPAFGERIGVGLGLGTVGPKRYVASALKFKELPPIDLVLLSHAHMDHMDLGSLKRFSPKTAVITSKDTTDILDSTKFTNVTELGWGQKTLFQTSAGRLEIEAFEVKHWGRRWPSEAERGYNGYILKREGKSLLFGGDTANTELFTNIRSKGPFEAALMPIGAYQPWIRSHCTPEEALAMANDARAKFFVPIHHQTFKLSEEPMTEPLERISKALEKEPQRLALKQVGETFVCPNA